MESLATGILGIFMRSLLFAAAWYILVLAARWRVFTKAGLAGWKSLIPLYSEYCTFKIAWSTVYFWAVLIGGALSGFLSEMNADGESTFLGFVVAVLGLTIGVINLFMNIKLSARFGHGVLFGLGLMLLTPVFTLILGLGESEFLGNPEEGLPPRRSFYM